jgi:hypothetical protein
MTTHRITRILENAIAPAALLYLAAQILRWGLHGFKVLG